MKTFQIILRHRVIPIRASSAIRPLCMWVNPPTSEYNAPYDALVERWKAFEKDMADVRSQKEGPLRWTPPSYKNEAFLLLQKSQGSAKKSRSMKVSRKQVSKPHYPKPSDFSQRQTKPIDLEMLSKTTLNKTQEIQTPISKNKKLNNQNIVNHPQTIAMEMPPINQPPTEELPRRRAHLRDKPASETPPTETIETESLFPDKALRKTPSSDLPFKEHLISENIESSTYLKEVSEKGFPATELPGKLVSSKQDRGVPTGSEKEHLSPEPSGNALQGDTVNISPITDDSNVIAQEMSPTDVPEIRGRGISQLHSSRVGQQSESAPIEDSPMGSTDVENTQKSIPEPVTIVDTDVPDERVFIKTEKLASEYFDENSPSKYVNNMRKGSGKQLPVDRKNYEAIRKYIAEAEVELRVQKQMLNTQREELKKRLRKIAMNPLAEIERRSRANLQHPFDYLNQKNRYRRSVKNDETRNAIFLTKNVEPISSSSQSTENTGNIKISGNNIQPVNRSYRNEVTVGSNPHFQSSEEYNDVNHFTDTKDKQKINFNSKENMDNTDDSLGFLRNKEEYQTTSEQVPRKTYRDSSEYTEGISLGHQPRDVTNRKMPVTKKMFTVHSKANSVRNNDNTLQSISLNINKSGTEKSPNRRNVPSKLRSSSEDYYDKENIFQEQRDSSSHRFIPNKLAKNISKETSSVTSETETNANLLSKNIVPNQDKIRSKTKYSKGDSEIYNDRETETHGISASQKNLISQELIAAKGSHSKLSESLTKNPDIPEFIQQDTYNELQESIDKKITSLVKEKMADQRGYSPSFLEQSRGKLRKRFMSRSIVPKNINKKSGYTYHPKESTITTMTKRSLEPLNKAELALTNSLNRLQKQKSIEENVKLSEPYQAFEESYTSPKSSNKSFPKTLNQTDQSNIFVDPDEYVLPTEANVTLPKKMNLLTTPLKKVLPSSHSERQPLKKIFAKQQKQLSTIPAISDQVRGKYRHDALNKTVHAEAYSPSSRNKPIPEYNYYDSPNVYQRLRLKQKTLSNLKKDSNQQIYDKAKKNESYNYPNIRAVQEYDPILDETELLSDGTVQMDKFDSRGLPLEEITRSDLSNYRLQSKSRERSRIHKLNESRHQNRSPSVPEQKLLSDTVRHQHQLKDPHVSQTANPTNSITQRIIQNNISAATDHPNQLNKSYSLPTNLRMIASNPKQKQYAPETDSTSYATPVNSMQRPFNSLHKDSKFHQYSNNDGPTEVLDSALSKKFQSQDNFRLNTTVLNTDAETRNAEALQDIEEDITSLRINLRPPVDTLTNVGKTFPVTQPPKIQSTPNLVPRFRTRSLDRSRPSSAETLTNKIQSIRSHSQMSSKLHQNSKLRENMFSYFPDSEETNEYTDPRVSPYFSEESRTRLRSNSLGKIDVGEPNAFTQTKTSPHEQYSPFKLFPDSEYSRTKDRDYFPVENKNIPISKVPSRNAPRNHMQVNSLYPKIPTEYKPYLLPNAGIQGGQNDSSFKNEFISVANLNNIQAPFKEGIENTRHKTHTHLQKSTDHHQRPTSANPYVEPNTDIPVSDSFESANDEFDKYSVKPNANVDSHSRMIPSVQSTTQSIKYHSGPLGTSENVSDNLPHLNLNNAMVSFRPDERKTLIKRRPKINKKPEIPKAKFGPRFTDSASFNINNFDSIFHVDESNQKPGSPIRKWKMPSREKVIYVAYIPPTRELS